MSITDDTRAYLNGQGTPEQQRLFQRAAERIRDIYREQHPSEGEDAADMTSEQMVGAAMLALGDTDLRTLGAEAARAQRAALDARVRLAGAMVAADIHGLTITEIASLGGVTRPTVYKWLGR